MIIVNEDTLSELSAKARLSPRLRRNLNLHTYDADPLQRMLNALEPDTYIRPHRHRMPAKREIFMILKGRAVVIEYTDAGEVKEWVVLGHETGNYITELPPDAFHSMISLESGTVCFEAKDGPYDPANDKEFALWAPPENTPEAVKWLAQLQAALLG